MSKQSELILSIVESCDGHMSADQIYQKAKESMPRISIGTVYRNLSNLSEEGHIHEVALPGEASRYERPQDMHGHLLCVKCGKLEDFSDESLQSLLKGLNTEVVSCHFTVNHICEDCAKKEKAEHE